MLVDSAIMVDSQKDTLPFGVSLAHLWLQRAFERGGRGAGEPPDLISGGVNTRRKDCLPLERR